MEYVRTYVLPKEEQLTVTADIQYLDGTHELVRSYPMSNYAANKVRLFEPVA